MSTTSPADVSVTLAAELPAAPPTPPVPVVYETLRQDATGGNVFFLPENPYLVPAALRMSSAQPVDLSELLATQQRNAAAGSAAAPVVDDAADSQPPVGVVKNVCRQPSPAVYYDVGITETSQSTVQPMQSPQQFPQQSPFCTDMVGATPEASLSSLEASVAHDPADLSSEFSDTNAADAVDLHQPSVPSFLSSNSAGPSPCSSAVTRSYASRLPSYEESVTSDRTSLCLSLVASPLTPAADAAMSESVLDSCDSPPAYVSNKLLEVNANTPLKSRQVQQLQEEMANAAGICVQLDKTQCAQALALIDCYDRVW